MKKIFASLFIVCILTSLSDRNVCRAQINDIGELMAAGADDAKVLLQPYITPAVNAFGAALGGGWFNTAKPHPLGGFDVTVTFNTGIIPKKFETFAIDNADLTFLQLNDVNNNISPTIAGDKESGPQMNYNYSGYSVKAFDMPQGLNANFIPTPMVQAGIGLIKGTEVMVRYMPNINVSDIEIGLWGLGLKHDVLQWIPGLKRLPILNVSLMYGYTKLHTFASISVEPDDIGAGSLPNADASDWDNQKLKLITQSQTANLIVSANLPVVCFYGGLGFITTKANLKLEGDYPTVDETASVVVANNPIDIEIKNQDGGITKPRFNVGMRFKFAVVTIHFDYSWANYSVLTGGLGVSIR